MSSGRFIAEQQPSDHLVTGVVERSGGLWSAWVSVTMVSSLDMRTALHCVGGPCGSGSRPRFADATGGIFFSMIRKPFKERIAALARRRSPVEDRLKG